jgi:tripartite-type tricarboxylate transporter receptor subunit TctC
MQTRVWNDYVKKGQLINAYLDSKGTQALLEEDYKTLDAIFTELGLKK